MDKSILILSVLKSIN